jgi:ATP-binding cassette subfamily B multidrug efflux pump
MADQKKTTATTPGQAMPEEPKRAAVDDDVVGKAYDGRLMQRLFRYLSPYKLQVCISAVAIVLKTGSSALGPYFVKVAVDNYFAPTNGKHSWLASRLSSDAVRGVTEIALLYFATLGLIFALETIQVYMMQWTGQKIMFDLRSQIFRHIQRMHVAFFDRNPVGRLVTRLTSDVDALNEMFTSGVLAIFEDIFLLAFIVAIMVRMSWLLALLTLSVLPFIIYATQLFRRHVRESYRRQRAATAKINSFTQEYVSGMSVVQLFNHEQRAFNEFSAVNDENKQAWTDAIFAYALYYPVVEFLSSVAIALVIWRGGLAVLRSTPALAAHAGFLHPVVTLGILIAFIQYAQQFFRPIQDLSDKYNILQAAMAASERIFKLLDTESEIKTMLAQPVHGDGSGRIEFQDVWFTYQHLTPEQVERVSTLSDEELGRSTEIQWILRGVSFTVEPDTTAAIVGHTGAGKTTITALMMRFYDVQRGAVMVDGVDVREQDLKKLRQRFGVVLQDPFLFSGTIAQNIRLGSNWITEAEVANAAEEVNVADFIRTLPLGFAEPVLERGSTLSTGQKQLISFARALAHKPGILILDEATSSVDTETEFRVRLALERMITGRTSVLIAHRLSTIQRADTILVMHKGKLREQGTHQELLAMHGLYFKLYQLQYKDQELGEAAAALSA